MPRVDFDRLPDHGRLWVFPLSRDLTDTEAARTLETVDDFLSNWSAHGMPLESGRELRERRFLVVGVNEDAEAPSGCSIDALVRHLSTVGAEMGVTFLDRAPVWYRDDGEIRTVSRAEFRGLADEGAVGRETRVFDPAMTRIRDLRAGALERPMAESWHGRAFLGDRA